MSLTATLASAAAGLDLSARRAALVAENVANADRPGYAARRLAVDGRVGAPGDAARVQREGDPGLRQLRRDAEAHATAATEIADFHARIDRLVGAPGDAGSLTDRLARLHGALSVAASHPNQDVHLDAAADAAAGLADKLAGIGGAILSERQAAEDAIAGAAVEIDGALREAASLNVEIRRVAASGGDPSDLMDRRSVVVDTIARIVPVRVLARPHDAVALVTRDGDILLDGRVAEVSFDRTALVAADHRAPADLAGLSIDGRPMATPKAEDGGRLAALFALRDRDSVEAMDRFDAVAAELIARSADPSIDPGRGPGLPGLFTDAGGPLDPARLPGLSARLAVDPGVDARSGGASWRLRDGLGATSPDPAAHPELILRLDAALADRRPPATGLGAPASLDEVMAAAAAATAAGRIGAEDRAAAAKASAATRAAAGDGAAVDVDAEMRRLLEIEQAYAANARVIQAVGAMMERLTEI